MSTNDSLTQSDENPSEQAITIQPSAISAYSGGGEWLPGGGNDASQDGAGGMALLHALRRHWLVIFSTGLACAAITGTVLWLVQKPQYKATALLELAPAQPVLISTTTAEQSQQISNEFEIFRDTQQSLVKSRFVIMAALRDPRLKNLACIAREDAKHNAIAWLTDEIRVEFPTKSAGIMLVSATEPSAKDSAALVNAVVDAYMNEVVNRDHQVRRDRLNELQHISASTEIEVRTKREQLKRELDSLGAGDEQTVMQREQMALALYQDSQHELQVMKREHRALQGKLKEANNALKELEAPNPELPETEVVMLLNTNPTYRDLQNKHSLLESLKQAHVVASAAGPKSAGYVKVEAELLSTKNQLEELEKQSREQVRSAKIFMLRQEVRHLESQEENSGVQLAAYEKEVEHKGNEADFVGKGTTATQMQRADIDNLERVLRNVVDEREHLRVELNSPLRVQVRGEPGAPAAEPESEARDLRYVIVAAGSILALLLPGVCIVMWDLRMQRINTAGEVSKRLRIPVMGTVPLIPATVMRRLGDTTRRSQLWRMRFTEAVDGVAARLLRKTDGDPIRVVQVTSAVSGEGKTTLATQLAMSLARAKRRTVLVDFDLRQPTLDGALGLPLSPGVCNALRGQGDVLDMVQPTETDCLSVLTAGSWSRQVSAALSDGSVAAIIDQLAANFEFVIIDSSPLLPVVDARLICQHVDGVVLSVFRDISQGDKVLAAQEMLDAFGVRNVEAVVTGGDLHGNDKNLAYQSASADEHIAPEAAEILEEEGPA